MIVRLSVRVTPVFSLIPVTTKGSQSFSVTLSSNCTLPAFFSNKEELSILSKHVFNFLEQLYKRQQKPAHKENSFV